MVKCLVFRVFQHFFLFYLSYILLDPKMSQLVCISWYNIYVLDSLLFV